MCLQITKKNGETEYKAKPVAKVAKKNIKVYKVVDKEGGNKFTSAIQGFEYKKDKLYKSDIVVEESRLDGSEYATYAVEDAFHSYTTLEEARRNNYCRHIVECVIPKGAKYYEERRRTEDGGLIQNEIASNKIKIKKVVKVKQE